jgi:U3 small nucleolar RNA-associated protein 21
MRMDRLASEGEFTITLRKGRETQDCTYHLRKDCISNTKIFRDDPFISHIKTLSPSAADLEIRSLNPIDGLNELVAFIEALTSRLAQKRDYELVQAWMNVFLRLHSDAIAHDKELINALRLWKEEQQKEARKLGDMIGYCSGLIGFLRSPRT